MDWPCASQLRDSGFFLADHDELRHDNTGRLLTTGANIYKILNITDLPQEFHVNFIDNPKHQLSVRRSKAVAEPPLMLGLAVWLAAQHALEFVCDPSEVQLAIPASGEAILCALSGHDRHNQSRSDSGAEFSASKPADG